jgi:hypothetical protein
VQPTRGRGGLLLLPAAAFAVHQLRYWLAYGREANAQLIAQGHSYLSSLVPWTILALAIGCGLFLRRLAAAARTGTPGTRRSGPLSVWTASWAALLVVYATQETLEGFLATGHPGGVAGVVGHGGWWAIPASAVVAALVTALLLLGRVLLRVAAAPRLQRYAPAPTTPFGRPADVVLLRPLARAAAGRAPPLALPSR